MTKRIARCVHCGELVDVDLPLISEEMIEKFGMPTDIAQTVCEKCKKK